jgi:hypothetical protein
LEEFYEKYYFYLHPEGPWRIIYKQELEAYGSSSQEQSIIQDLKGAIRSAQKD